MLTEEAFSQIKTMASEVCARESCRLYDIEFSGHAKGRVLRVFIDGDEGVNVDQCANVSRGLSLLLDVNDVVPGGQYELEVSSPGLERQLREPWHFEQAIGERIKVRTNAAVFPEGAEANKKAKIKQVTGSLTKVTAETIELKDDKNNWVIPYAVIHKANLVFDFGKNPHKDKKANKR